MKSGGVNLSAETILDAVKAGAGSLTQIWQASGGHGNAAGSTAKKMRSLVEGLDAKLVRNKTKAASGNDRRKAAGVSTPKSTGAKGGKFAQDSRNPFRSSSSYAACFNILAAHRDGLRKDELIRLLAEATGKDAKHAGYDAQVLLSARPNEDGLSNNDSPRHRSCRPGFWVKRENDHVWLMVD